MTTLLYSHPARAEHDPGSMHPESPARLAAVLGAPAPPGFAALEPPAAPPAAPRPAVVRVWRWSVCRDSTVGVLLLRPARGTEQACSPRCPGG